MFERIVSESIIFNKPTKDVRESFNASSPANFPGQQERQAALNQSKVYSSNIAF